MIELQCKPAETGRLLKLARAVFEDEDNALRWLTNPQFGLGDRRPLFSNAGYGILCQSEPQRGCTVSTRNVVLTDHQEKLIEALVSSGRYQNASEVLREGLRLVETRDSEEKARLKSLRDAARTGIADIEAGRFQDFGSNAELRAHLDTLVRKTIKPTRKR